MNLRIQGILEYWHYNAPSLRKFGQELREKRVGQDDTTLASARNRVYLGEQQVGIMGTIGFGSQTQFERAYFERNLIRIG
jgi:hypothetical protein